MSRSETITALKQYFKVKELVCPHTYQRSGENAWQFLSTCYLETLLVIREQILADPMYCNTSNLNQRGLRCNLCPIVANKQSLYLSAHILGKAGDFTVRGLTAEEARNKIIQNAHLLPYPIRMEKNVTWLHIDTLPQHSITEKIHLF